MVCPSTAAAVREASPSPNSRFPRSRRAVRDRPAAPTPRPEAALSRPRRTRAGTVGEARVIITQPRLPCYKLAIRFTSDAMVEVAEGRQALPRCPRIGRHCYETDWLRRDRAADSCLPQLNVMT